MSNTKNDAPVDDKPADDKPVDDKPVDDELAGDAGDDFVPATDADSAAVVDTARDGKGRFKVKTETPTEKAAVKKVVEKDTAAEEEEEGEEEGEEEEGEEEEEGDAAATATATVDDKKSSNYRIRQLVEQRADLRVKLAIAEDKVQRATKAGDTAEDQAKALEAKLDELYTKVEEARADGDVKLSAQLQREIDRTNTAVARAETTATAQKVAISTQQNAQYDSMLDFLETARPVTNPNSPEFDERVTAELDFQVKAYEKMGLAPTVALHRAAALLFEEDPFSKSLPAKQTAPAAVVAADSKRKTDIAKNVDAAKRTPAKAGRSEEDVGSKVSVKALSDDEFAALPKSKMAELSGDNF